MAEGIALYVYDRERANFKSEADPVGRYPWWGFIVGDIERILRRHIRERLSGVEVDELTRRCLSDIDRRAIPELESSLAQLRAEVDE